MSPQFFIHFTDRDAPGVPQGYRGVAVKRLGWKWVSCVLTANGKNFKMRRAVWDALKKDNVNGGNVDFNHK